MEDNELLDFSAQSNFDFFRFQGSMRGVLSTEGEEQLKKDCEGVLKVAYATVQNLCELGVRLRKIKESQSWHHVVDPATGDRFLYSNFAKFCKYAFGFSPTRTSNLLSLSEFLYLKKDGTVAFLNDKYKEYKTSALIEIASVNSWERRFFSSDMTVDEIRLVKKYMKSDDYRMRKGSIVDAEDMLDMAQAWEESERAPKRVSEQLPGQTALPEEVLEDTEKWSYENPTSDFCDVEVLQEEVEESASTPQDFVAEVVQVVAQAEERYEFAVREKARAFLAGYKEWTQGEAQEPFIASYVHTFPDGKRIHAREGYACKDLLTLEKKVVVRYFWEDGAQEVAVSKTRVVAYLRTAKDGAR